MKYQRVIVFFTLLCVCIGSFLAFAQNVDSITIWGTVIDAKEKSVKINVGRLKGLFENIKGNVYLVEKKKDGTISKQSYVATLEIVKLNDSDCLGKIIKGKKENIKNGMEVSFEVKKTPLNSMKLLQPVKMLPIGLSKEATIKETIRLTSKSGANIDPVWAPQGDRIYFVSNRNNDFWNIYSMKINGTELVKLTNNAKRNFAPQVSSDGSQVVFISSRDGDEDIYKMNYNGTNVVRLTKKFNLRNDGPAWSPDGKKIAFVSFSGSPMTPDADIYMMNSDGTGVEQVTMSKKSFAPNWSPDGKKLLFVSGDTGHEEICYLEMSTKKVVKLTDFKSQIGTPRWSPDGTKIAFMINPENRSSHICVMSSDGTHFQQLTTGKNSYNYVPFWSPDGQSLVYIASEKHVQDIYIMKLLWK